MEKVKNKNLKEKSIKWIRRHINDPFVKQKNILGYRSRSAFKLIELNNKFNFLNNKKNILDLGSSPGGWSQVISKLNKNGKNFAIDILTMKKIYGVKFMEGDFLDPKVQDKILNFFDGKIDVVISDMASNTTGNKNVDTFRTSELCLMSMDFAKRALKQNGAFISKIFMGYTFNEINKKANEIFKKVTIYKPNASRKKSRELYIFCKNIIY